MRTLLVTLLVLLPLALAPAPAEAPGPTCATSGVKCVRGALVGGWSPAATTVAVGQTVVWESSDGGCHPVEFLLGAPTQSACGKSGMNSYWTPTTRGIVQYGCANHASMQGVLVVV